MTSYVNPDLDGVSGIVAYAEYLNKTGSAALEGVIGAPQAESVYVLDRFSLQYPNIIESVEQYDRVVLVDASELIGLESKVPPERVIEIIDHRKVHDAHKFPNASVQIELVGAAATLVGEKFMQTDTPISDRAAVLLESAIISNTLNFKSGTTTDRDRAVRTWLNQKTHLPEEYWVDLFTAKSDMTGTKLGERIDADFAWFDLNGVRLGCVQLELIGVQALFDNRLDDIRSKLSELKSKHSLDLIFATCIELKDDFNMLLSPDEKMREVLTNILEVTFYDDVAKRPGLIMRKQMTPLIVAELKASSGA